MRLSAFLTGRTASTITVAMGILLALAILLVVRDSVALSISKKPKAGVPQASDYAAASSQASLKSYSSIVKRNIFGGPSEELRLIEAKKSDAEPVITKPDIMLVGVIAWADGKGFAIIQRSAGSREQEIHKTGAEIENVGKLVKVMPKKAVIIARGVSYEYDLVEVGGPVQVVGAPHAEPSAKNDDRPSDTMAGFARQTSDTSFVVDKKAIDASIENPQRIMTEARLVPRMVDNMQEGFIIKEIKKSGIYDNLGLKNGDVLLSVNGLKLSDPSTSLQAFTALRGMDHIQLDLIRGGHPLNLTYDIK